MGQGQMSHWSSSKVKWVKPSLKVIISANGLTSKSSCFIQADCLHSITQMNKMHNLLTYFQLHFAFKTIKEINEIKYISIDHKFCCSLFYRCFFFRVSVNRGGRGGHLDKILKWAHFRILTRWPPLSIFWSTGCACVLIAPTRGSFKAWEHFEHSCLGLWLFVVFFN